MKKIIAQIFDVLVSILPVLIELLVVFLFVSGVAMIAVGLWRLSRPVAFMYIGAVLLYMAACISKSANSPGKDGKK